MGITDDARCWQSDFTVPTFTPPGPYELQTVHPTWPTLLFSNLAPLVVN